MSVKVIVTDMDGTFLNDAKTYNQPRFMAQYQELKKRGIEFVVASGNQYYQLISFFPELKDEIDLFCRGKRRTGLRTWQAVVPRRTDPT